MRTTLVLAALAAIAVAWFTFASLGRVGDALIESRPAGARFVADVGHTYTDVLVQLRVEEGRTIRIDSVEMLGDVDQVARVLDIQIADGGLGSDMLTGFPPTEVKWQREVWESHVNQRPVEGAVLTGLADRKPMYRLVIGYEVYEPGRWHRSRVRIHYTEAGESYFQDKLVAQTICTRDQGDSCTTPDDPWAV